MTYAASWGGVAVNLAAGTASGSAADGDVLIGIENLAGSSYADALTGNSAANTLDGGAGDDTLAGGTGNDTLFGGSGNDVYLFNPGDGQDLLTDTGGNDTLMLGAGLNAAAASYDRSGTDIVITFAGTSDQITIAGRYSAAASYVDHVQFSDGTVVDLGSLILGTSYSESLTGTGGADYVDGKARNDVLDGGDGNDTLRGGTGNDIVTGGAGADVYLFSPGDGIDTISGSAEDVLMVGAGYTASQVEYARLNGNLQLSFLGTNDKVIITGRFVPGLPADGTDFIREVRFADGSSLDLSRQDMVMHNIPQGGGPHTAILPTTPSRDTPELRGSMASAATTCCTASATWTPCSAVTATTGWMAVTAMTACKATPVPTR